MPMKSVYVTTLVVSPNPAHGEVYYIQHYVIKCVSDLRQFGGFRGVLRFPPSIHICDIGRFLLSCSGSLVSLLSKEFSLFGFAIV
jgi:hypothetical protein